jgi:uroporphyrinogen-III synthase
MAQRTATRRLEGRSIVVTRPAEQAAALARRIEREGGRAIVFPAIAIEDVDDRSRLDAIVDALERFDMAVFISPNAAAKGMQAIRERRDFPPHVEVAAIGTGTARELESRGLARIIVPDARSDSEALLERPELVEVAGKRIVIFRGEGGRPALADTLRARGARVEYAECYRRSKPAADTAPLAASWSRGEIDAVIATSSEGLRNFHEMLDAAAREALVRTPLFVPHPRIAEAARGLGIRSVFVTASGDEGLTAGLAAHFGSS